MARIYPPAIAEHLAARKPLLTHALVWLTARDRDTKAVESIGLWTGPDHQVVPIDGSDRVFHGIGAILGLEPLVSAADMNKTEWALQVSSLHAQVIEALRVYDARLAPVEAYLWYWDPASETPLAPPVREFRGTVMDVDLPTPPEGGTATSDIRCVSDSWMLTQTLTIRRSDAALQARAPGDGFRRYGDIGGSVPVAWGEKLAGQVNTVNLPFVGWYKK